MVEFVADQNQTALFYESGTYNTASGAAFWVGMVQNDEPSESTGVLETRYAGQGLRTIGQFVDGPTEFGGTLEYFPQNFRMLKFAMGLCADSGSPSPYLHTYTSATSASVIPELSGTTRLPTFTQETAQVTATGKNVIRTFKGCMVDKFTINVSEGNIVTCNLDFAAQSVDFSSGAKSSVTASTLAPYRWADSQLHIPSGTQIGKAKEYSFSISNGLDKPNYCDATRNIGTPIPLNLDYEVSLTMNGDDVRAKALYNQYFLGGSTFNALMDLAISAGSRDGVFSMSGCKMTSAALANPVEGVDEHAFTFKPQVVTVVEASSDQFYNAGSYA